MNLADGYFLSEAEARDASFISIATVEAERAHTGIGIWDVLLSSDGIKIQTETDTHAFIALGEAIMNSPSSHLAIDNFSVIRSESGEAVACCSCYMYPKSNLSSTFDKLREVLLRDCGWTLEEYSKRRYLLSFLDTSFPDDVPYGGSWFIETVYTDASHRQKGLSSHLIRSAIEKGRQCGAPRCMLVVASGNDGARRLYEREGFVKIAEAYSAECMTQLKCPGFDILCLNLSSSP